MRQKHIPVVLSIAGSDSGGGAGIQADLNTFAACGVFGTTAVTCITAQNPSGVSGIQPVQPGMVYRQIKAVADGFRISAAKTGMLYSAGIIMKVAEAVDDFRISNLVVDPVMMATSGARLLRSDAERAMRARLLCRALVITPNIPEAVLLSGMAIRDVDDAVEAGCRISREYGTACIVKGGHLGSAEVTDILCADGQVHFFRMKRIRVSGTHGTGCTF